MGANILNLGAACKPKPFVNVCTASDCICGEYHCDLSHICRNCPMVDGVRVSPCDSGNVTNVGEDNDAATVAAMKDAMATPTDSADHADSADHVTDAADAAATAT